MAAIAYPRTYDENKWETSTSPRPLGPSWGDDVLAPEWPALRLVPPATSRSRARRQASTRVYRRRRLVVGVLVAVLLLAAGAVLGRLGGGPLTAPETAPAAVTAPAPAPRLIHVVQPGDTLWVIARALQPTGDVRPLVDRLEAARHGQPLRVGEVISLR
jgi:LysM repeat protein